VPDDDTAVAVANRTRYGLGAGIWSADTARAVALGNRITSGAVFINAVVAYDPRLPFGGTRRSGYGRDLGALGLREFVNTRTWVVADPTEGARP
jgi:succinate-semialdehyde dehydrogenase/glutarate-semialdehyde dehydrogenase